MHLLAATSRSAGAGDAGGWGGPLPRPASPGRLRAAPPAAGGLPSPDLTAAAAAATAAAGAARGRSAGSQPSALAPPSASQTGEAERRRVAVLGLPGIRSGKLLRAGVRLEGRARAASGGRGGGRDAAALPGRFHF